MAMQATVYALIAILSRRFEFHSEFQQRPIVLVIGLLVLGFGLHLWGLRVALRCVDKVSVTRLIWIAAVLFRITLLPSWPIQEVDIYRYLWDGAVTAEGGNPYRFSPQQILHAPHEQGLNRESQSLVELQEQSAACQETLKRIHYGELITVYPPVSQAVFGLASLAVPRQGSLYLRIVTMKLVLMLFDLGTLWLLLAILHLVNRHSGWAILYGWSPLVLKEFANSGHLDSIAVCLTTCAVWSLLKGLSSGRERTKVTWLAGSAVLLGLGVGAKLYPIVLLPGAALWVLSRTQFRWAIGYATLAIGFAAVSLSPMLMTERAIVQSLPGTGTEAVADTQSVPAGSGLATFLSRWEINDLIFLLVVENLRPDVDSQETTAPHWFVVIPNGVRESVAGQLSLWLQRPVPAATFLTARALTLLCFGIVLASLLRKAVIQDSNEVWLRTMFLTLAWFWAFAPTLNPWYWTWAMPFLPFAGRRAWCFVSLFVLAYYLRFWLLYHDYEFAFWGTHYQGEQVFHFVVAPLEHGVWLTWLTMETFFSRSVWPTSQTRLGRSA